MKKNRSLPFGYQIQSGKIALHENEADAVRLIFREYLQSRSLKAIAGMLNDSAIPYSEATTIWSKSTVKRVLDNRKYTGTGEHPMLVDPTDFENTQALKAGKYSCAGFTSPLLSDALKGTVFCLKCGGPLTCRRDSRFGERWYCRDGQCKESGYIIEGEHLLQGVVQVLNQIITAPRIIQPASDQDSAESLEAIKLRNAYRREINKSDIDSDYAKSLLMAAAAERYNRCRENHVPTADTLRQEFENMETLSEFDSGLYKRSIRKTWIGENGSVRLELHTGQTVDEAPRPIAVYMRFGSEARGWFVPSLKDWTMSEQKGEARW